ncbi:MAG: CDP-alcohol phosphatidyltransferase family protein [Dehalococcoidia bacterium]
MPTLIPHTVPSSISMPVARAFARTGITPNQISALGFLGNVLAGVLVGYGSFAPGAIVMLVGGALDLVDGALARLTGRATAFGEVFDAVLDRFSEGVVLFGLLIWELNHGHQVETALIFATVVGSFMVSYTRARAEVIRMDVKEGLFTRVERVVLLALALLLHSVPYVLLGALWFLAVFTNITAMQRLYYVWTRTKDLPPISAP